METIDNFRHYNCSGDETKESKEVCNKISREFFEVEEVYIGDKLCKDVYEIKAQIGETSASGEVYLTCCSEDCRYVLKQVYFKGKYMTIRTDDFLKEVKIQQYLSSNYDISPKIYQIFLNKEKGAFIMDAMSYTTRREIVNIIEQDENIEEQLDNIFESVYNLIENIHSLGVYHGDAHLNNFMKRNTDGKWMVIDFGQSQYNINDKSLYIKDYIVLYQDLNKLIEEEEKYETYLKKYLNQITSIINSMNLKVEYTKEELELIEKVKIKVDEYKNMIENLEDDELSEKIEKTIRAINSKIEKLQDDDKISRDSIKILSEYENLMYEMIEKL